jgi:hypothetical protein
MNKNTAEGGFTEEYFFQECFRARESFGDARWWDLPEEKRESYFKGLNYAYLNIQNEDGSIPTEEQIQRWADVFQNVHVEYEKRKLALLLKPFRSEQKPNCPICKRPNGVTNKVDGIYRCYMVNHPAPVVCEEEAAAL